MLTGRELNHETWVCAARDRILYLSQELEEAQRIIASLMKDEEGSILEAVLFMKKPRTKPSAYPNVRKRP